MATLWNTTGSEQAVKEYERLKHLETIFDDEEQRKALLQSKGNIAQAWLDLLQLLSDHPRISTRLRSSVFSIMVRLAKNSGLHPKCLSIQNVEKLGNHPVGGGGFGDVWEGVVGDGSMLKLSLLRGYLREAILWRQLRHRNVLPFLGIYFLDGSRQQVCLVSPWMEKGNLVQFLKKAPPEAVDHLSLAHDVASGLAYLHYMKIVHGDLKGLNILITIALRACIADFGLSRVADTHALRMSTSTNRPAGTARWLSPELLQGGSLTTKESDVYAYACVCYEIFTGLSPFYEVSNEMAVALQVLSGQRPSRPETTSGVPDAIWSLMERCWVALPSSRPTANDVLTRFTQISHDNLTPITPAPEWDDSIFTHLWSSVGHPSSLLAWEVDIPRSEAVPHAVNGTNAPNEIPDQVVVEVDVSMVNEFDDMPPPAVPSKTREPRSKQSSNGRGPADPATNPEARRLLGGHTTEVNDLNRRTGLLYRHEADVAVPKSSAKRRAISPASSEDPVEKRLRTDASDATAVQTSANQSKDKPKQPDPPPTVSAPIPLPAAPAPSETRKLTSKPPPRQQGPADPATNPEAIRLLGGHTSEVFVCQWNPKKHNVLATGAKDAVVKMWNVPDPPNPFSFGPSPSEPVTNKFSTSLSSDLTCLCWNSQGTLLAVASYDSILRICDASGNLVHQFTDHKGPIFTARFSPSGRWLATASLDNTSNVWDMNTYRLHRTYEAHQDCCLDVDWINDTLFASCGADKVIHVLSVDEPQPLKSFHGHQDEINQIKSNPSGTKLASCSDDTTTRVWNAETVSSSADSIPGRLGFGSTESAPVILKGHKDSVSTIEWFTLPGVSHEMIAT
ncbi:hypothetical protein V5O48_002853 [Marasmius crinis-equi]|uniref:Protein kinase domain-containing protein n=1 Tax=Marasmius crinis-equi TaxID=585013 RepID=A0ABR3FUJ8_9AGAR